MVYETKKIEPKWQHAWYTNNIFKTGEDRSKPKKYILDMFPYPSGAGLHVGHPSGYTATDIISRFYRQKGFNVLHPMGWDAFGLPAEQYAIETGQHPSIVTNKNIENFRRQLKQLGLSFDWDREVSTCDPNYYKWTQYIFTILYEKGLAYQAEVAVNWCPELKTVLANEEVIEGKSERGGHPVHRVPMRQWMLKITAYADRLLEDLNTIDWPESVKEIQRNWIGRSVGAKVRFALNNLEEHLEVFTTRPDTLYGATYMVLAPEHTLIQRIMDANNVSEQIRLEVSEYRLQASRKSDLDRTELSKEKTGVFSGGFAIHPLTKQQIPIYISDYVLITYGTGAIMAVPAHDERDHEFALKFNLPIVEVVKEADSDHNVQNSAFTGNGNIVNSPLINGLTVAAAKEKLCTYLEENALGEKAVNYKLRDWLFSRQRYWGEPIPILKRADGTVLRTLNPNELPLTLPEVASYEPTGDGKSPLSAIQSWVQREENGATVFVETDTMPGSAGSSWYFLRYCDPLNQKQMFSTEAAKYWLPVDLYVGGQEHAVGHLLYARFWTKVLFDAGVSPVSEPFQKLVNQGMITRDGAKMSKSKGNGVSPDDVIRDYSADALRVYIMFMGPLIQVKDWQESNLAGVQRFLSRTERLFIDENGNSLITSAEPAQKDIRLLHKTLKKITEDVENLSFNTAVAQMMIFVNGMYETGCRSQAVLQDFLICFSTFAPHLAEEIWQVCFAKQKETSKDYPFVSLQQWPSFDPALAVDDSIKMGVQINGKHRGEIEIPRDAEEEMVLSIAHENEHIRKILQETPPRKTIYVKNRILNFVV